MQLRVKKLGGSYHIIVPKSLGYDETCVLVIEPRNVRMSKGEYPTWKEVEAMIEKAIAELREGR